MVNKGFKHSEKTKRKISEALRGENNPSKRLDVREKISLANKGKTTWMKGKNHTDKSKRKMSEVRKGIKLSKETKDKMSKSRKGKHYPRLSEAVKKRFEDKTKHPMWKGGVTPLNRLLRASSMWKIWREAIFLRDNFTCQNKDCEFCENRIGVNIHPHHIKQVSLFPELVFKIDNGITYCAEYHLKTGIHKGIQVVKR